jgi:hypothetical protein
LVVKSTDSNELTGAMTALTAKAMLGGSVPAGCHFCCDVLNPALTLDYLQTSSAITTLEWLDCSLDEAAELEGGAI